MSEPVSAVVKHDGASLSIRFDACRVFLGGEFAGNIEIDVCVDSSGVSAVADHLRVQWPGSAPSDTALGSGAYTPGVELVFWTQASSQLMHLPPEITLLWGDAPIAQIVPVLKDSVPVAQAIAFTEPAQVLTSIPVSTSNLVLLAANREKWWLLLTALLVVGGSFVGLTAPGLEFPNPTLNPMLGGAMIAAGLGVGFVLAGIPYRQVWLDRDRRRVFIIEGRTRHPASHLAAAPSRSMDEFDHVRVYQRWQLAQSVDEHDQEIWFVTLEAPIPFASADGTVHLHADALPLGRFTSEFAARKLAAEVGSHTGLKILDTGHDQTA